MMGIGDNILADPGPTRRDRQCRLRLQGRETAWSALDGVVGDIVRADIDKDRPAADAPQSGTKASARSPRSTKPINTPDDLHGFKIRVPPSPISLSLFKDLGAAPVTLNVAELYTALQTHVVDGQENPLGLIETQKLYQVQKYCSLTNHMWVGYWMLVNGAYLEKPAGRHQNDRRRRVRRPGC